MVGGFNDDVHYCGRRFHVQTELGLRGTPRIVTLLYEGGAILHSERLCCGDRGEVEGAAEELSELMGIRHRALIRALTSGELDELLEAESPATATSEPVTRAPAFGAGVVTELRLDEWLIAHLAAG